MSLRTFAQRWVDETLFYRSGGYVAQTVRWLDAYVSPAIGDMQLDEIHPGDVLAIIKARADTAVTAERIRVIAFPSIFRGSVPMGDVTLNQLTASNPKCNTSSRKVRTCKNERDTSSFRLRIG